MAIYEKAVIHPVMVCRLFALCRTEGKREYGHESK